MSNVGTVKRIRASTPASDVLSHHNWRGWEDKRQGRGFPTDYDAWPEHLQRNYELGRCRASAAGANPPRWPRNMRFISFARRSLTLVREAVSAEGRYHIAALPLD